jgi:hypothetical protein
MGSGGGGGGSGVTEARYAPYVETAHQDLINRSKNAVDSVIGNSPFSTYDSVPLDDAFFGYGYMLTSFPSIYDMYGKFIAGLDIDALYDQLFNDTVVDNAIVDDLVSEKSIELSDEVEQTILPRFEVGMRDINAVVSSTFVIGRSIIESNRLKELSKFSSEIRYKLIPIVNDRWKTHLDWNKGVIELYAQLLKLYISGKLDSDRMNYEIASKNILWPFTVLDNYRMTVAAMTGAVRTTHDVQGTSPMQSALSGAMVGAAGGYMVTGGNPIGAVAGGVLGFAAGLFR